MMVMVDAVWRRANTRAQKAPVTTEVQKAPVTKTCLGDRRFSVTGERRFFQSLVTQENIILLGDRRFLTGDGL